jgi:hypothetical protein
MKSYEGYKDFWMVPAARMREIEDTLTDPPWVDARECNPDIIRQNIAKDYLDDRPWDDGEDFVQGNEHTNAYHAQRIAYLVNQPDYMPIIIDVGIPDIYQPEFFIFDGCHRLAAALFRGDEWIAVAYSGAVLEFRGQFPTRRRPTTVEIRRHTKGYNAIFKTIF